MGDLLERASHRTDDWLSDPARHPQRTMRGHFHGRANLFGRAGLRGWAHLAGRPYLQAVYDEPEYVVRNIWRLYGGWWDGQPAHLKPARESEIGREVAALAGGPEALADRARALAETGGIALACHLADWAAAAAPIMMRNRRWTKKPARKRTIRSRSLS